MKKLIVVAALAALATTTARAEGDDRAVEIAPFAGAWIPTGDQRDLLDDAPLLGVTASWALHRNLAVVGTFGWAPSQVEGLGSEGDLDLFQYDVGVQGQLPIAMAGGWTLKPFVGLGVGARTYSFRDLDVDAETDLAGYVAVGGKAEYGPVQLGLSARDYVSAFDGIGDEADSTTRNDLGLLASLGVRF